MGRPRGGQATVELILDARARLGEGPVWDASRTLLWWVDIEGHRVHRWSPEHGARPPIETPSRVGAVALREEGGLLVALEDGLWLAEPDVDDTLRRWAPLPDARPDVRLNDGKCDPQGRFWVGSMRLDTAPGGARLYRADTSGRIEPMLDDLTISNGLAWSADGQTMYHVDTPTGRVDAFDFDGELGAIDNRRVAVDLSAEDGSPDGMTIDSADHLWVAMWGGAAILRCRPASAAGPGAVMQRIEMPVRQPTSCTFGGPNLDQLFITSAAEGLPEEDGCPHGGLFRLHPAVGGLPADSFGGQRRWLLPGLQE